MNLILLDPGDFDATGQRVQLTGRRATHVRLVLGLRVGDERPVGVVAGSIGQGRVTRITDDVVEMDVVLDGNSPPVLPVTLVLALPRPKVLRRVLQGIAAAGVRRLFLIGAWRVEKSYWDTPALEPASVRDEFMLGLEQGGATTLPQLEVRQRFRPFVEDELASLAAGTQSFVADPSASKPCPHAVEGELTLVVGPDAGFNRFELDLLAAHGCRPVHLGPRQLRVENAIPTLLGRLLP